MVVGVILYLYSHPIFARNKWKRKMSSKICVHAIETHMSCHNYRIHHKIGFECMRLRVWMWFSGWVGFYANSMKYLRYFCELFMVFAQKQNHNLYRASHAEVEPEVWLRSVWEVWPGAWILGTDQGWLVRTMERLGLSITIRRPRLSIYQPYIYKHIFRKVQK